MGIFDSLSPDQAQGLLAAAAQMLQQSGPSRTPVSFGQIAGSGLQAYQGGVDEAQKRRMQMEQAAQGAQLHGLQIQGLQGELQDKDTARQQQLQAQEIYRKYNLGQSPTATAQSVLGSDMAPTQANAEKLTAAQGAEGGQQQDEYTRRMGYAAALRGAGLNAQADAAELQALKFKPEFDQTPRVGVGVDGKPFSYVLDKAGNKKLLEGVLPRDELHFQDTGGGYAGLDKFTGRQLVSGVKTATPGELLSNSATIRGQNLTNQRALDALKVPQFNQDVGGFITSPTTAAPGGTFTPLTGYTKPGKPLTEDQGKATGWLVQAENAFKNMKTVGLDKDGNPTSAAMPGLNDALGAIPGLGAMANSFRSADRQKFIQASSSLSEALLRAATGAGVNKDEAKQKVQELTPLFGEDKSVTQQKFDAIPLYIESLKVRAGAGAAKAEDVLSNAAKVITLADIAATAKAAGKTTAEVTKAARDAGYTVRGQ